MLKQIHPGAVLLLHTVSKDNADALDSIITDLKKQGYVFKSLDDLMISKQLPNSDVVLTKVGQDSGSAFVGTVHVY